MAAKNIYKILIESKKKEKKKKKEARDDIIPR
jgi:hypothetical protein